MGKQSPTSDAQNHTLMAAIIEAENVARALTDALTSETRATISTLSDYTKGTELLARCLRPEFDVSKRLREYLLEGLLQEPWEPPPAE